MFIMNYELRIKKFDSNKVPLFLLFALFKPLMQQSN